MARRLMEAREAGQAIQQGKDLPTVFNDVLRIGSVPYDKALGSVYALQYSFDGNTLAVGFGNGAIRLYESKTGKFIKELRKSRHGGMQIMCIKYHPFEHHILLAASSEGKIFMCNTTDDSVSECIIEKGNQINTLDFNMDGDRFATAGSDHCVRVYHSKAFREEVKFEDASVTNHGSSTMSDSVGRMFSLKYHPTKETMFVTGGFQTNVKIWDERHTEGVRRMISGPTIRGDGLDIFVPEVAPHGYGGDILTGSWVNHDALQIWDFTTGELKKNIPFPADSKTGMYLYCARFCDHDVVLAGGSGTNSAKAINHCTGQVIGEVQFNSPVTALDSVHKGRFFAVGAEGNKKDKEGGNVLEMCALV